MPWQQDARLDARDGGRGVHSVGTLRKESFGGTAPAPTLTARPWPAPPGPEKEQPGMQLQNGSLTPAGINGLTGKEMGASVQPLLNSALTQLPPA